MEGSVDALAPTAPWPLILARTRRQLQWLLRRYPPWRACAVGRLSLAPQLGHSCSGQSQANSAAWTCAKADVRCRYQRQRGGVKPWAERTVHGGSVALVMAATGTLVR